MKRLISLMLCLIFAICTPLSASANDLKIIDDAGLLTDAEILDLEQQAEQLVNQYQIDVVILTVDSLNGKDSEAFADDYFDYNSYGIGPNDSGILLLLSMEYRDWAISTCGDAIYAVTDYSVQNLFSQIAGYLSEDQYYFAFCAYLNALESVFEAYANGTPIDGLPDSYEGPGSYVPGTQDEIVHYEPQRNTLWYLKKIATGFAIGVIVALIVLLIMRSQMNTAKAQRGAESYLLPGTYQIRQHQDIFLYSHVSKVRKSENSSSGGGGSSVHRSSSGRSHGGGHGKF